MDVAFVVMPFADVARPSIGVSLLKAGLDRRGFTSKLFYFNIDFAALIGVKLYAYLSDVLPSDSMVGEWFFADLLFPDALPPAHEFVQNIIGSYLPADTLDAITKARTFREEFVEKCASRLTETEAPVIGFTTTFHQTCASLSVAKRLKASPKPPAVIFGGANCEGEMGQEMLRSFPWIDYVCTREGDAVFPEFIDRYLRQGDKKPLPGLMSRGEPTALSFPLLVENLDDLPVPDYHDYLDTLAHASLDDPVKPELQIETARGCWWGAKHHCTFCGLNGDSMRFRSKSPERVYAEFHQLYEQYGIKRIDSVDNILDHRYIASVFPKLCEDKLDLEIFYEVKANLKYPQLKALRDGGVQTIQPGIESFSNQVLSLMHKGVSGLQNIQLLKWSEEVGILAAWNILAGFPGEAPEEYEKIADLIPLLTHLEPPTGCSPIRLDRFSPLFVQAEQMGLQRVRPTRAYYYVYPLGRRELSRLAYFFDFDYADGRNPASYIGAVQKAVANWRNARFASDDGKRPRLDAYLPAQAEDALVVFDSRQCAVAEEHRLQALEAEVLVACDAAHNITALRRQFSSRGNALEHALKRLKDTRLLIEMEGQMLSLPVLRNRPAVTAWEH